MTFAPTVSFWLAATLLLAAALPSAAAEQAAARRQPLAAAATNSARVIVKYKPDAALPRTQTQSTAGTLVGPQHAQTMGARLGLELADGQPLGERSQVIQGRGLSSASLASRLAAQSDVEWAVADRRRFALGTANDPLYPDGLTSTTPVVGQWYLRAPTSTAVSAINAMGAWDTSTGSSSIVVAVLDTGVRFDHADLAANLLSGHDFISDSPTANDGGGRDSDASDPGDWVSAAEDSSGTFAGCGESDSSWHGTQVAGLIAAVSDNSVGMASVARNVRVLPVRVLGKCGGYDSDIIAAMRWAAGLSVSGVANNAHPARVINLSLGSTGSCSTAYQEAVNEIKAAGVVIVAAAGNEGLATGTPANCSGVIAVAALRNTGTKVGYSSLGSAVAISAPGGNCVNETGSCLYPILTTTNTGTTTPVSSSYSDGSNASLGTSFSAPLVSGTVALMLSADSSLTPGQVASLLSITARSFPSSGAGSGVSACQTSSAQAQTSECYCTTSTCGAGMLDASAAVAAAAAANASGGTASAVITVSSSTIQVGDSVTLDGSSSVAASGSIASYAWSITSGSSVAAFSSATASSTATLNALAAGTVTVQLTVTDSAGNSASTARMLTVSDGASTSPTTAPTAAFTVSSTTPVVGATVMLDAAASSATSGRSLRTYLWEISSGAGRASFKSGTDGETATLLATATGSVTVRLTVTDSAGESSSSSQTINVLLASADDSGGGTLTAGWSLALLAATLVLGWLRRRTG